MQPNIAYSTKSIKVDTPDGVMFVHIVENEYGTPIQLLINIGKCGTNLAAWADSMARLASALLPVSGISGIIDMLSGITSSKLIRLGNGEFIRSGPEGLASALLKYTLIMQRERNQKSKRIGGPSIEPRIRLEK